MSVANVIDGALSVSIEGNSSIRIFDLPVGVKCHISEQQPDGSYTSMAGSTVENGYSLANVSGNDLTTRADNPIKTVFTNHKDIATGSLHIHKIAKGGERDNEAFDFRITLTSQDGSPMSGVFHDQHENPVSFDSSGTAYVSAQASEDGTRPSMQINGIPVNTRYTVEESVKQPDSYTSTPETLVDKGYVLKSVHNATGVVTSDDIARVYFVNQKTGTSLVTKEVINDNKPSDEKLTHALPVAEKVFSLPDPKEMPIKPELPRTEEKSLPHTDDQLQGVSQLIALVIDISATAIVILHIRRQKKPTSTSE